MRRYYSHAPSGSHIVWLRIHPIAGTWKALPLYGALLKATTVTADFANLLVTMHFFAMSVHAHVTCVEAEKGTKTSTTLIYWLLSAGISLAFPLERNQCLKHLKTPHVYGTESICIKGRLDFNINSLTQIFSSWQLTGKKATETLIAP